jgi:hypothetical protein
MSRSAGPPSGQGQPLESEGVSSSRLGGCERNGEVRDPIVEALQKFVDNRLDDGVRVVFTGEGLDCVDRVPCGGDDELGFTSSGSGQDPGVDKASDGTQMRQDRLWEMLTTVAIDTGLRPYPFQMRTI